MTVASVARLVLTRPYNGIGDWLFCLAVLTMLQRQRPEIAVFVDFSVKHGVVLPALVPQAYAASNLRFKRLSRLQRPPIPYAETRDSLVYRRWPPDCYIESTVAHLNQQTGLGILHEAGVYPDWGMRHVRGGDAVVMIGHGKRRHRHGKEWGYPNFNALAQRLTQAGIPVVQIGSRRDARLESAQEHILGASFETVAQTLCRARAYVGIENGIMVLAGFLGVPQVTLYDGSRGVPRTSFNQHTKIVERVEPAEAFDRIAETL